MFIRTLSGALVFHHLQHSLGTSLTVIQRDFSGWGEAFRIGKQLML